MLQAGVQRETSVSSPLKMEETIFSDEPFRH